MKKVDELRLQGPVTRANAATDIKRRFRHVAPSTKRFKSTGSEQRFTTREKRINTTLGPSARKHRAFKLYGEGSMFKSLLKVVEELDPNEVRKEARRAYQKDVKSGKISPAQRVARVWSQTSKKPAKAKVSARLLAAYKKLTT